MRNGTSGSIERRSITTNAAEQRGRDREQRERLRRSPAGVQRVDERVDEQREARGDRDRPERVEPPYLALAAALVEQARREQRGDDRDRDVDPEDPLPAEVLGQHAAEQHARRAARARHRAPDAQRLVALGALREHVRDHRQRGRREDRGAEALHRAPDDQLRLARREAAEQRGDREQHETTHEQAPAAEQVGHSPAEQQEAAERQRVRVRDPGEVLRREVQVLADRRDRDVDDRDVQDDHELRRGQESERQPFAALSGFGIGHRWYSRGLRVNMRVGSA